VLFTGRPLAIKWENANVPAILNVWFGGSETGYAISDVLFGDVNPSGKLTTTWPQNVGQVPYITITKTRPSALAKDNGFRNSVPTISMFQRSCLSFWYGLSYTNFTYGDLKLSRRSLKGNQTLTASVAVTNSGIRDGKEVVQLYIRDVVGSITRPVKELKGFQKISLKAGETKTVTFSITTNDLKFYNNDLKYDWESGDFMIMVGGNSRDVKSAKVNWVKAP
jgi:beta-glucosidase